MEYGIEANALDFLIRSVEAYHDDDNKAAIIYLWSCLLLYLKLRLFRIHPVLILSKEKYHKDPSNNSVIFDPFIFDFNQKTVDFRKIYKRLAEFAPSTSALNYKDDLVEIQRIRNRVEHLIDNIRKEEYSAAINKAMNLFTVFVEKELNIELSENEELWDDLLQIQAFYEKRVEYFRPYIYNRQYESGKQGEPTVGIECPNCSDGTLIDVDDLECPICKYHTGYKVCEYCGEAILDHNWSPFESEIGICDDCFSGIIERSE